MRDTEGNEDHAPRNARNAEHKFGLPAVLWMAITNEFRKYFDDPKEEGAFLAGLTVGWIEYDAHRRRIDVAHR